MVSGKNHRLVIIKTLLEELRQGRPLGMREVCGVKNGGTRRKHTVERVPMAAAERCGDRLCNAALQSSENQQTS